MGGTQSPDLVTAQFSKSLSWGNDSNPKRLFRLGFFFAASRGVIYGQRYLRITTVGGADELRRRPVELSLLSNISELFDTALENCRDQTEPMPGAPQPPMPQRPCGRRAYKTPAWSDQLGSFHAALGWARSPLLAAFLEAVPVVGTFIPGSTNDSQP
jgi:hypothetical protein